MAANGLINGAEPNVGGSGYQQFDENVEDIDKIFRQWFASHHENTPDRGKTPDVDSFDAFVAGVEYGKGQTPPVEEFGDPYVAPNVDDFAGFAEEGTPGFADPEGEYRQQPPGFSLDPNDPRNAYLNQGIPPVIMSEPIDVSDIGRRGGP